MRVINQRILDILSNVKKKKEGGSNAAALWTFLGAEKAFSCKDDLRDDESGTFYARKAQKVT